MENLKNLDELVLNDYINRYRLYLLNVLKLDVCYIEDDVKDHVEKLLKWNKIVVIKNP